MTAIVSPDQVSFDNVSLVLPPTDSQLRLVFGPPREESIPLHGGAMRTRCIVDTLGIVFYRDDTPPEVPSLFIAFWPEDTPGSPAHAFPADVWLGGSLLLPDATEAEIRSGSSLPLTAHSPHCFCYASEKFSLQLEFRRRRNRLGKRSGVHRLAFASFSFHATNVASPPTCDPLPPG